MNGNSLARQFTETSLAKDVAKSAAKKRGEKCGEKCGEKRSEKCCENSTAEKQLFGIYHDCFHFGLGTLLATRFLDPFPRRSGSVTGSPSAQCNPLSNVMRLNVLKDFIHSILGAALIKTGTYHGRFVASLHGKHSQGLTLCPSKSRK